MKYQGFRHVAASCANKALFVDGPEQEGHEDQPNIDKIKDVDNCAKEILNT